MNKAFQKKVKDAETGIEKLRKRQDASTHFYLLENHIIIRANLMFSLSDTSNCQPTDLHLTACLSASCNISDSFCNIYIYRCYIEQTRSNIDFTIINTQSIILYPIQDEKNIESINLLNQVSIMKT